MLQSNVMPMPWTVRVGAEVREMMREVARQAGVKTDSHLRWVPIAGFFLSLLMALGAIVMAYGVWRGRDAAEKEAIAANQAATAKLVTDSEARLLRAAEELRQSAKDLEVRLMAQVSSIDGKVESMRSIQGDQDVRLAELRAELRSANEDKARLWQELRTEQLKRERDERERLRGQSQTPNREPGG